MEKAHTASLILRVWGGLASGQCMADRRCRCIESALKITRPDDYAGSVKLIINHTTDTEVALFEIIMNTLVIFCQSIYKPVVFEWRFPSMVWDKNVQELLKCTCPIMRHHWKHFCQQINSCFCS